MRTAAAMRTFLLHYTINFGEIYGIITAKERETMTRPPLSRTLDSQTFRSFYYLKAELIDFCRQNGLPASGGKPEITERIAYFLDTGEILKTTVCAARTPDVGQISEHTKIEPNFKCTEKHRAFFKEKIGPRFSFHVGFQKWLKANTGKTYGDAITAYYETLAEKKRGTIIDPQFEYNTYIRDFYADNHGAPLCDAIACWKYKKSLPGHNRYELTDLAALSTKGECP